MLKIITFCIVFFSGSIFANNCSEHVSKNLMTLEGKVANVGPDHSMEVVIKTGEKSYYLLFKNRETKNFFIKITTKDLKSLVSWVIKKSGHPVLKSKNINY